MDLQRFEMSIGIIITNIFLIYSKEKYKKTDNVYI